LRKIASQGSKRNLAQGNDAKVCSSFGTQAQKLILLKSADDPHSAVNNQDQSKQVPMMLGD